MPRKRRQAPPHVHRRTSSVRCPQTWEGCPMPRLGNFNKHVAQEFKKITDWKN